MALREEAAGIPQHAYNNVHSQPAESSTVHWQRRRFCFHKRDSVSPTTVRGHVNQARLKVILMSLKDTAALVTDHTRKIRRVMILGRGTSADLFQD